MDCQKDQKATVFKLERYSDEYKSTSALKGYRKRKWFLEEYALAGEKPEKTIERVDKILNRKIKNDYLIKYLRLISLSGDPL